MSSYDNNQPPPVAYPPAPPSIGGGPYLERPPPVGYLTKDGSQNTPSIQPRSRCDGLWNWKGWCAVLCSCCLLDPGLAIQSITSCLYKSKYDRLIFTNPDMTR
ncbi:hypothetical protein ACOSQ3_028967 [Xanthoceras sorbifolium]